VHKPVNNLDEHTNEIKKLDKSTLKIFHPMHVVVSVLVSFVLIATLLYLPMARHQAYLEHQLNILQHHVDSISVEHNDNRTRMQHYVNKYFQSESIDYEKMPLIISAHYRPTLLSSYQVAPAVLKMVKFTEKMQNYEKWDSEPFFAFAEEYLMHMSVYAAGNGDGNGTHVSIFLHLMKGPYDDDLQWSGYWPLRGNFTIEVLDVSNSAYHYGYVFQQHYHLCTTCTSRVVKRSNDTLGWRFSSFISHDTLLNQNSFNFLYNDTLIF